MEKLFHSIPPVFDENSKILILGSFPSPKSREFGFYYGHPKNRFWQVLSAVTGEEIGDTPEEKKDFLLKHGIALWDVIESCYVEGASDTSIREESVNDFNRIFSVCDIKAVFTTGKRAYELYKKHVGESKCLPSTSPANCAKSLSELIDSYKVIREFLK